MYNADLEADFLKAEASLEQLFDYGIIAIETFSYDKDLPMVHAIGKYIDEDYDTHLGMESVFDKIKDGIKMVWDWIKSMLSKFWNFIKNMFKAIKNSLYETYAIIRDLIKGETRYLSSQLSNILKNYIHAQKHAYGSSDKILKILKDIEDKLTKDLTGGTLTINRSEFHTTVGNILKSEGFKVIRSGQVEGEAISDSYEMDIDGTKFWIHFSTTAIGKGISISLVLEHEGEKRSAKKEEHHGKMDKYEELDIKEMQSILDLLKLMEKQMDDIEKYVKSDDIEKALKDMGNVLDKIKKSSDANGNPDPKYKDALLDIRNGSMLLKDIAKTKVKLTSEVSKDLKKIISQAHRLSSTIMNESKEEAPV